MRHPAALALLAALSVAACGEPAPEPADAPVVAPPAATPLPTPAAAPATTEAYNLIGTEPFWGLKVRSTGLVLSRMDHEDVPAPLVAPQVNGETTTWRTDRFEVTIRPAECSDGMSDRRYPFEAEVKVGAETLKGCAFRP